MLVQKGVVVDILMTNLIIYHYAKGWKVILVELSCKVWIISLEVK